MYNLCKRAWVRKLSWIESPAIAKVFLDLLGKKNPRQDGKDNQYDLCQTKGINGFPSWEIKNKIYSGVKNLKDLANMVSYEGDTSF